MRVERIEFYFSSVDEPWDEFKVEIERIKEILNKLSEAGVEAELIDVSKLSDFSSIYHRAISGKRKPFFIYEQGFAYEDLGRKVPFILIYEKANDRVPADVYPRREGEKLVGVLEALEGLLKNLTGRK